MDVQCERCKTEYEFDDALVSGRGTTVRCTNCGHQFKVRRASSSELPGGDEWVVQAGNGAQLTFVTLRELQRAILAKQVVRGDLLRRGGDPPRPLGTIAELEPFFEGRASSRPPPPGASGTAVPRFPPAPSAPPVPAPAPPVVVSAKRTASWGAADVIDRTPSPEPKRKIDTLRPTGSAAAVPPPAMTPTDTLPVAMVVQRVAPPDPAPSQDAVTQRRPPTTPVAAVVPPPVQESSPQLPLANPFGAEGDRALPPQPARHWQPSSDDLDAPLPRRRRVGGWIVAFVLFLAVGVMTWIVARPYLASGRATAVPAPMDSRAQGFVVEGERALTDNNLEMAQEDFDKASALAERDPRVLLDEARVAAAKADLPWLKLRLLPSDAAEELRATKAQLADDVGRVRRAADAAVAVAPEDLVALRAKIDALRLAGDRDQARSYVSKVVAQASQAETAYVLAALDLSEPEPPWTTVIERLRIAAAGETSAGRARAALIYALARSGDASAAKAELARLDAYPRPYPLAPGLHALVNKASTKPSLDGGVASNVPHVDVSVLPSQPPSGAGGTEAVAGDGPASMLAASHAIKKGDWARARKIYEALAARNPSDSEALAGIGDCQRAQGDSSGAIAAYRRALAVNPSYLPALLGLADTQWVTGDRGGALHVYKDIEDRFPEGTYPSYVKTRSEPGAPPPATAISPAPTAPAATSTAPAPASTGAARPDPEGL